MFNADCPINSVDNDVLDRKLFAESIAKAITSYSDNECLSIGIYGGWGTGKTSLANMIIDKLPNEGYAIIKFDSWQYSNMNELIYQIFKSISKAFKMSDVSSVINGAANAIGTIGSIIKVGKYIPVISSIAEPISNVFKDYSEAIKHNNDTGNSLDEIKAEIDKTLVNSKIKLVFVIDDIDRLTKDEIRLLFQAIKALGDFSNTIYILLMDKEVVENSLNGIQGGSGSDYLKKIIQIPVMIPEAHKVRLKYLIHLDIQKIITLEQYNANKDQFDSSLNLCVLPYVNNLRDIKRIFNLFIFKYSLLNKIPNFSDLFVLCTLEIYNDQLYHFIENRKAYFFSPKKLDGGIPFPKEFNDYEKEIIFHLFPFSKYGIPNNDYSSNRIFDWKIYNSCFLLNIPSMNIPEDICSYILNEASVIQIIEIMKSGRFELLPILLTIENKINDISSNRLITIFSAIKQVYGFLIKIIGLERTFVNKFCSTILSKINSEATIKIIKNFFSTNDDCEQELLLTDLLISEEHFHNNWLEIDGDNYMQILVDMPIEALETACSNINCFADIFAYDYSYIIKLLYVWEKLSFINLKNSIKGQLNTKNNALKFLISMI